MFYKPSGKASIDGLIIAAVIGGVVSIPLAAAYAYAILYIPIAGTVTFILSGGFAFLVALAVGMPLHSRKVRSPMLAGLVGAGVGFFATWVMWVFWLYALLHRDSESDATVLGLALNPFAFWSLVLEVNRVGAWSFKGSTPTGGLLWALWSIEALIIIGLPAWFAQNQAADPFCEQCEGWCADAVPFLRLEPTDKPTMLKWLQEGRFDAIADAPVPTSTSFHVVNAQKCECGATNVLNVAAYAPDNKGNLQESSFIKHVLLPRDGIATLTRLKAERVQKLGPDSVVA